MIANDGLIAAFNAWTGTQPTVEARAPGRVNLIGEHTDYNQGLVLPAAINYDVQVLARPLTGRTVRLRSLTMGEDGIIDLDRLQPIPGRLWLNYAIGLLAGVEGAGHSLPGMDLLIQSDVPMGAGLSSSAAYEMALVKAFEEIGGFTLEPMEAVRIAQRADWDFVGVQSGIMDQSISRLGRAGDALLLDCRSLEYRYVPINVDAELIICHTGIPRELAHSAYNERREECERAVEALRRSEPTIRSLRDVTPQMWEGLRDTVPEPYRSRAEHVVTENARVLDAAEALDRGDLPALAALFAASHRSLRDGYAVSSRELDTLVEIAHEVDPLIAARLTGAGFGGCTINLVPPARVEEFEARVVEEYPRRTGRTPTIYPARTADGASGRHLQPPI
jgi:galactokinase